MSDGTAASKPPAEWQDPVTAPRDGTQILGDFGWPWPVMAAWDEHDRHWVVCILQRTPMSGGEDNTYFEVDTELGPQLRRWHPLPELPPLRRRP